MKSCLCIKINLCLFLYIKVTDDVKSMSENVKCS